MITVLSNNAIRMIKKYPYGLPYQAYKLYDNGNIEVKAVALELNVHFNTAKGLINAGRELDILSDRPFVSLTSLAEKDSSIFS